MMQSLTGREWFLINLKPADFIGGQRRRCAKLLAVKVFFTGPVIKAELLVVMLEKHGIAATQEFVDPAAADDGDLDRATRVLVPEADYERAYQLFYAERQDEF